MPRERLNPTLADYIVLAINPALIMGLVGSLVFFLLDLAYAGLYGDNLRTTLFWFVLGSVLIARISVTAGIENRAGLYGIGLGGAVWLAMSQYIEYPEGSPLRALAPAVNLFLIALVWWCAHRLTIDCTHMDDDAEIGNEGLLQAARIGQPIEPGGTRDELQRPKGGLIGWLERYDRYRAERRKKRTPGVWVVYFSLAALPLFGLGQSLIPAADSERRQAAFRLLCQYVGCGLGLLMTTAFLGLRRYLRQRNVQMPTTIAGAWLSTGALLVVIVLIAAALAPRPAAEVSLFDFQRASSQERDASRHAAGAKKAGKDAGKPGAPDDRRDSGPGDAKDKGQGDKDKDKGAGKDGDDKDKNGSGKKDGKGKDSKDKQEKRQDGAKGDQSKTAPRKGEPPTDARPGDSPRPTTGVQRLLEPLQSLASVLRWVVFLVLGLVVLFVLLRAGLSFLANFTGWARRLLDALNRLWASLFGGGAVGVAETETSDEPAPAPAPFAAFHNPFADGRAARMTPRELASYTLAALQAWALERDLGRASGETELEFARRVGAAEPALEADAQGLARVYTRLAYAPGLPADNVAEPLRNVWQRLERDDGESRSARS